MATTTTALTTTEASQLNTLRTDLKQWEKAFAEANGGRKAGRYDIKQDPEIAAKYKTYGRLRALEESTHKVGHEQKPDENKTPSKQNHARTKRKFSALTTTTDNGDNNNDAAPTTTAQNDNNDYTPRKARRVIFTPTKNCTVSDQTHPAHLDPYDSPSVFRRLFSPSTHRQQQQQQPSPLPLKTAVGPTPQRNGRILGLFDMLSASGGSTATPSANRTAMLDRAIVQTPSRRNKTHKLDDIPESAEMKEKKEAQEGVEDEDDYERAFAMGRTPASSSKKLYLERLFATPTTLRFATMIEDEDNDNNNKQGPRIPLDLGPVLSTQPIDQNPLDSGTPSFLRRSNSGRYVSTNYNADSDGDGFANGVRRLQRFNSKGLSSLVQGLRDMEKERIDEDWDILNEIEAEQQHPPPPKSAAGVTEGGDVQVGDSQAPQYGAEGDSPVNGGRVWKKMGQKRTTRLVKMKPVARVKNRVSPVAAPTFDGKEEEFEKGDRDDESEDELAKLSDTNNDDQPRVRTLRERKPTDREVKDNDDQNEEEEDDDDDYDSIDSDNPSDQDFTETRSSTQGPRTTSTVKPPSSFSEKIKAAFSSIPTALNKNAAITTPSDKKEKESKNPSAKRRKINPEAHANYRSLKIRSRGQGRFRRGRFGRR